MILGLCFFLPLVNAIIIVLGWWNGRHDEGLSVQGKAWVVSGSGPR